MKRYLDGEILKNIVADANMTLAEFARFAGINSTYLSELLQGQNPIGVHCRKRLAEALIRLKRNTDSLFLSFRRPDIADSVKEGRCST